jgi:nitrite reductase/ring-hydroxylating ferredoxin subunit
MKFQDGEPCEVLTDRGTLKAKKVVVATHSPSSNKFTLQTKIAAYRTYAIGVRIQGKKQPSAGLFWDLDDPYHYIRQEGDVWIIGGEDHKTGQNPESDEAFRNLKDYTAAHFGITESQYQWSGQVIEPVDGLPYIGVSPLTKHHYVATGFSGNGMTFGTLSGMIISDLILGKSNPYENLYDPKRIKPRVAALDYVSENKDYPLCLLKGLLPQNEVSSVDEIKPGEGKKIEISGKATAVYRDQEGKLHAVTATCPHMGCKVNWNPAESTWDCPCHGGRFDCKGKLLNGPPKKDLDPVELPSK